MYINSLFRWQKMRLLRAGYCFIQLLDDILDGDRRIDKDPGAYADELVNEMTRESFSKSSDASMLIGFVLTEVRRRADYEGIKQKFIALVIILKDDYHRRIGRRSDESAKLAEHHWQTFQLSLDITLAFLGSKVTSTDCPEIINSLVWCSTMRDLRDDLAVGIINIPKDVHTVPSRALSQKEIEVILNEDSVQTWIREEFKVQAINMQAIGPMLPHLKDNIGRQTIKIFWKSIRSYVPKFEKQNRALLSNI